jgi:hypothetical protein
MSTDQVDHVYLLSALNPKHSFSKINLAVVDIMAYRYFRKSLSSPSKSPAGILKKIYMKFID